MVARRRGLRLLAADDRRLAVVVGRPVRRDDRRRAHDHASAARDHGLEPGHPPSGRGRVVAGRAAGPLGRPGRLRHQLRRLRAAQHRRARRRRSTSWATSSSPCAASASRARRRGAGTTLALRWASAHVPIWLAAEGPRTQQLAGRIADGVVLSNALTPRGDRPRLHEPGRRRPGCRPVGRRARGLVDGERRPRRDGGRGHRLDPQHPRGHRQPRVPVHARRQGRAGGTPGRTRRPHARVRLEPPRRTRRPRRPTPIWSTATGSRPGSPASRRSRGRSSAASSGCTRSPRRAPPGCSSPSSSPTSSDSCDGSPNASHPSSPEQTGAPTGWSVQS